jgi:hypothetical protein
VKSALTPYLHLEGPNFYPLYSLNVFHKHDDDRSSLFLSLPFTWMLEHCISFAMHTIVLIP